MGCGCGQSQSGLIFQNGRVMRAPGKLQYRVEGGPQNIKEVFHPDQTVDGVPLGPKGALQAARERALATGARVRTERA